jgi:dolichol-phosphate mannosyltransferase
LSESTRRRAVEGGERSKRLTVVVAAYDEVANVEPLLRRLDAALSAMPGWRWNAIFVVEGRDGSREVLERVATELGVFLEVDYREAPSGLGAAFRRGFAAVPADADVVVTLDADLNHQPEEIPRLVEALERREADVVIGSRFVGGSRVEGTPLWKRLLSGTMNRVMRVLYGVPIGDKTSGFRVYRAEALRSVAYDSDAFAFLPELLIRLHRAGWRIVEEPIRFVFREQGRSKLAFWPTSFSYLTLLRTRFDRWSVLAAGLLAVALVTRLLAALPIHKSPHDADVVLGGLCGLRVLRGELPVFFTFPRLGSLECYAVAAAQAVFGPDRLALHVAAVPMAFAAALVAYLFLREVFGRRAALVGLAWIALPGPALLYWTQGPNGYPMGVLLSALLLWLAARAARTNEPWTVVAFAGIAGLGFWHSFQTLGISVPAAAWLCWRRAGIFRPRLILAAGLAAAAGAAPWWMFNLRYGFAAIGSDNVVVQPVASAAAAFDNALYFVANTGGAGRPGHHPTDTSVDAFPGQSRLAAFALAVFVASAAWFLVTPLRQAKDRPSRYWWLLMGPIVCSTFLAAVSSAGSIRGLTVRYAIHLVWIAAALLTWFLTAVAGRSRALAASLAIGVLAANAAAYQWPGRPERERWTALIGDDERLVDLLEGRGVDTVIGRYWSVYPINYLTRERVLAVPCRPIEDYFGYSDRVPDQPRWGLVSRPRTDEPWIDSLIRGGLVPAEDLQIGPYRVVIPRAVGDPEAFLGRVRETCGGGR